MKPDPLYVKQAKPFWAHVRSISQHLGYTERSTRQIKVPGLADILKALNDLGLAISHIVDERHQPTEFGKTLLGYFQHRANILNTFVKPRLMDVDEAKALYEEYKAKLSPSRPPPMNKQKGEKRSPAYLTALINMLIEVNAQGFDCDFDPRELTTVTLNGLPLRTLARRVDGAFPSPVNPIAVWEIKEYYYTTTFGSRVADGVYESLLDGMELEELREHEKIDVKHLLMIDSHYTWWECGRSYLCRIVDMMHMEYVDEVLFGREVVERLPGIVKEWVAIARRQKGKAPGAS